MERGLKKIGWYCVGSRGDHFYFKHPTIRGKITVPHYKSIGSGALSKILLPAEIKPHEFVRKYVREEE